MSEEDNKEESTPHLSLSGVSEISLYDCGHYYLFGEICEESALEVIEWIHRYSIIQDQVEDDPEPLHLFINSLGGTITECMAIVDAMRSSSVPIFTHIIGKAYSAGHMIAVAGHYRTVTERSDIMAHQWSMVKQGTRTDLVSCRDHEDRQHKMMLDLYTGFSTLSEKEVEEYLLDHKDNYLTTEDALRWGLVDEIIPCR